jgi:pimeloyl-ACP methyl ester carboxylesterase
MNTKNKSWVLLRGLGREVGHWNDFPERMHEAFPHDEVIALDLPGAGEFRNVTPPFTINGFVKFLRTNLEKKDPRYPLHLLSISLGGMVALEWMKNYPTQIHSGVLINSSLGNLSPFYDRLKWQNYFHFFSKIPFLDVDSRELELLNILSNKKVNHNQIAQEWGQLSRERPIKFRNILQQLAAASQYKIEETVKVPTLLLVGLGDNLVNPKCSLDIQNQFNYPLAKHPWGGHDLTIDDPDWVINEIKSWHSTL